MECWAVSIGALTFRMVWAPIMACVVTVLPDEQGQIGWLGDRTQHLAGAEGRPAAKQIHWSRR